MSASMPSAVPAGVVAGEVVGAVVCVAVDVVVLVDVGDGVVAGVVEGDAVGLVGVAKGVVRDGMTVVVVVTFAEGPTLHAVITVPVTITKIRRADSILRLDLHMGGKISSCYHSL